MSNGAGQRRRLAWAWSRVLLATMACVQAAPAVAQEPTEDVPCLLTNGMAQLHTEDSPASCADGCSGLRKSPLPLPGAARRPSCWSKRAMGRCSGSAAATDSCRCRSRRASRSA